MAPEAHDAAFAAVSHLPHLLAFALMGAIQSQPDAERLLALAGPGFRDFTRIAAGDPALWRDVLLANREQVLAQSQQFAAALDMLQQAMRSGDGQLLHDLITLASTARARWRLGDHALPTDS